MKKYVSVMLGKASAFSQECFEDNFIGIDFGFSSNLKNELPENWNEFNKKFIPVFIKNNPAKSKVTAGLACMNYWNTEEKLCFKNWR